MLDRAAGTGAGAIPAFAAQQLVAPPTQGWLTNGGSLWNQRWSPLTLLNRGNAAGLKAVWWASLNGSGLSPHAGNQTQPLVYGNSVYVMTGDGDAFAVDIATGQVVWSIQAEDPRAGYAIASPTQPFPVGDAVVPQYIDMPPGGFDLVNEGRIFTPFAKHPAVWKPLVAVNWPPSSYDPQTHLLYVCATDSLWGAVGDDPNYPVEPGVLYSGSVVQRLAAPRRGVLAALDMTTNRIVWRPQRWPADRAGRQQAQ